MSFGFIFWSADSRTKLFRGIEMNYHSPKHDISLAALVRIGFNLGLQFCGIEKSWFTVDFGFWDFSFNSKASGICTRKQSNSGLGEMGTLGFAELQFKSQRFGTGHSSSKSNSISRQPIKALNIYFSNARYWNFRS